MIGICVDDEFIERAKEYIHDAEMDVSEITRIVNEYDYVPEGQKIIDATTTMLRLCFVIDVLITEVLK